MSFRLLVLLVPLLAGSYHSGGPAEEAVSSVTVWQLPEQTRTQMMSYVLRTRAGKLAVIDGGTRGDAPALKAFLKGMGGEVEAWFLTHPHSDHADALGAILTEPDGIRIGTLYASLPSEDWVRAHEPESAGDIAGLNRALKAARRPVHELQPGEVVRLDGVRFEVLAVKNPEIVVNAVNNSSVVLRVQDSRKTVLFLGDLGLEGGDKLLAGRFKDRLRAEYVQMAHHGQRGVSEAFYRTVRPSYCLWPTPSWLWENDSGKGKGSGPWETLKVRGWMDGLDIRRHYVTSIDGLSGIE